MGLTILFVGMREFDSKSVLQEFLRAAAVPSVILGLETPATPREFFCVEIRRDGLEQLNIGILSFGVGVKPSWVLQGPALLIGFNDHVAVFDTEHLPHVAQITIPTLFWEFLDAPDLPHTCVVCETGVLAISSRGFVHWRVDTQLISNYKVDGRTLSIEFENRSSRTIDLLSGQSRRSSQLTKRLFD